ncbi:SymE family type I addiction module toxin [Xenorhabdus anantnagensis]|uniref:SymE family type I addiction module toxin n=1 Tax=Xenorhabdus anantnagensis TaxID=3025875 RepID=A0ABT5LWK3_9GAMM|nr:SymE family type I addiction module toxin [Xenorhabdus anantnagensis]MDC9598101.1 SymE family type I addiction module toxin [Xenorhabdus anantnagensis]
MAKAHSKQNRAVNKAAPPAIHLKGQWLKAAGFDIGGTLTVKIMDGCIVLIPDSDGTRAIRQQYERQQDQLSEIKLKMRKLIGDYQAG